MTANAPAQSRILLLLAISLLLGMFLSSSLGRRSDEPDPVLLTDSALLTGNAHP